MWQITHSCLASKFTSGAGTGREGAMFNRGLPFPEMEKVGQAANVSDGILHVEPLIALQGETMLHLYQVMPDFRTEQPGGSKITKLVAPLLVRNVQKKILEKVHIFDGRSCLDANQGGASRVSSRHSG